MPSARKSAALSRASGAASTREISSRAHSGGLPFASSGWQRLQGRYPANRQSFTERKNSTFSRLGRDGHEGRQKIPVVFTAT